MSKAVTGQTGDEGATAPPVRSKDRLESRPFLHSALFVLYPILALYADNASKTNLGDLLMPLLALTVVALAVLAGAVVILHHLEKAGFIVSGLLVFTFVFAGAAGAFRTASLALHFPRILSDRGFSLPWALLLVAMTVAIIRTRRDLKPLVRFTNVAALVLVGIVGLRLGLFFVRQARTAASGPPAVHDSASAPVAPALTLPADPPDIYYLIFDRYASAYGLRKFSQFDNEPFVSFLREQGFTVYDSSRANYPLTHLSLASSLNLRYLGPRYLGQHYYRHEIANNAVVRALRAAGYRYIHLGSWYEATRTNPQADETIDDPWMLSEFSNALLRMTPFQLFFLTHERYDQVLYTLGKLENLPREKGPKFVFAHLIVPHPPYVFHTDGSMVNQLEAGQRSQTSGYLEQLQYLNTRLSRLIPLLIRQSGRPPIIILQGDEGPYVYPTEEKLSADELWCKRAEILNAYYLPGTGTAPHPGITPVNTFRLIFDRYFSAGLPLLDDRVYGWSEPGANGGLERREDQFDFVDVTGAVAAAGRSGGAAPPAAGSLRGE